MTDKLSKIKFRAEKIEYRYLQPGDFYSHSGPDYWSKVGEDSENEYEELYVKVAPGGSDSADEHTVYKITLIGTPRDIESAMEHFRVDPNVPPGYKQ